MSVSHKRYQDLPAIIIQLNFQLALVQTKHVKGILEEKYPGTKFEIVEMSTKGDNVQDRALFKIGDKSLFTKELEIALIKEDVLLRIVGK